MFWGYKQTLPIKLNRIFLNSFSKNKQKKRCPLQGFHQKQAKPFCATWRALIGHWFGTMECHKKPDMDHVRWLFGNKSILNTSLYVNMEKALFNNSNYDYIVKVVSTIEETCKVIEVGFEHVTEMEGKQLFRKRK
jgi:hypothetical protein